MVTGGRHRPGEDDPRAGAGAPAPGIARPVPGTSGSAPGVPGPQPDLPVAGHESLPGQRPQPATPSAPDAANPASVAGRPTGAGPLPAGAAAAPGGHAADAAGRPGGAESAVTRPASPEGANHDLAAPGWARPTGALGAGPDRAPAPPRRTPATAGRASGASGAAGVGADGPARDPLGLRAVRRAGAITLGMAVLMGLLVWLYGTSATSLRPRDLPILTVGPEPAATALADQISRVEPGALSVHTVGTVAAADRALRDRDAYAAIVIGDAGLTLRVASAASPAVTEAITRGIRVFMPGLVIPVVDVVPNAPRDQGGGGLAAGYLPMVLLIAATGVLLTRLVRSRAVRLAGIAALAVLSGFAGAVALRGALHVLPGSFLTTMAVVTLLALAVAAPVVGAGAVAGVRGLVGAVLVLVVGGALSAASSAPEMLPRPWGDIGQFAPPGAGATLLRSTSYFDGAAGGRPVAVLAAWLVVGLWLAFVGERGASRAVGAPQEPGAPGPARPGAGLAPMDQPWLPAGLAVRPEADRAAVDRAAVDRAMADHVDAVRVGADRAGERTADPAPGAHRPLASPDRTGPGDPWTLERTVPSEPPSADSAVRVPPRRPADIRPGGEPGPATGGSDGR